jgi:short-subunit dehydrogenase
MNQTKFLQKYGSWAIVTGASNGIGKEFAIQLAKIGFNVVLVARRKGLLEELSDQLENSYGIKSLPINLDLGHTDAAKILDEMTTNLDVGLIVSNAGFGTSGNLLDSRIDIEKNLIDLNCRSLMELSYIYGQKFAKKKRGGIILISSLLGFFGTPGSANYAASKAFVQSFGEGFHSEMKRHNVDVLTVAPGPVHTGFAEKANMNFILALNPENVAKDSINALGKKITLLPGFLTKFLYFSLQSLLIRNLKIMILGLVMKPMIKK